MPYRMFLHIPHFHFFDLPEEVKHFYTLSILRAAFLSVGALFLPLYIYSELGLFYTLVYLFLSYGVFRFISKPLNLILLREWGIEVSMFFSIILSGVVYFLVFLLGVNETTVFIFALLEAFAVSLYWDTFHVSFSIFGKSKEFGEEVGELTFIESVISILTPIAASGIIYIAGFHTFYGLIFILTALISLMLIKSFKRKYKINITFGEILQAPFKRLYLIEGILNGFLAPSFLLLYLVLKSSVLAFGAVKTVIGLFMAVFSHLLGKYFDKKLPFWMGKLMYVGNALYSTIILFTLHPLWVVLGEMIRWILSVFHVTLAATLYHLSRKVLRSLSIARSFYITLGSSLSLLLILLAYTFSPIEDIEFIRSVVLLSLPVSLVMVFLYREIEEALSRSAP